jgi:hypothetical protein
MPVKYIPNDHRIYQPFPSQDPPQFTQIGIFGLKTFHLATLMTPRDRDFVFEITIPAGMDSINIDQSSGKEAKWGSRMK